jgi:hypothetical protein
VEGGLGDGLGAAEPGLEALQVEVDDRGDVEGEGLGDDEAADEPTTARPRGWRASPPWP